MKHRCLNLVPRLGGQAHRSLRLGFAKQPAPPTWHTEPRGINACRRGLAAKGRINLLNGNQRQGTAETKNSQRRAEAKSSKVWKKARTAVPPAEGWQSPAALTEGNQKGYGKRRASDPEPPIRLFGASPIP